MYMLKWFHGSGSAFRAVFLKFNFNNCVHFVVKNLSVNPNLLKNLHEIIIKNYATSFCTKMHS